VIPIARRQRRGGRAVSSRPKSPEIEALIAAGKILLRGLAHLINGRDTTACNWFRMDARHTGIRWATGTCRSISARARSHRCRAQRCSWSGWCIRSADAIGLDNHASTAVGSVHLDRHTRWFTELFRPDGTHMPGRCQWRVRPPASRPRSGGPSCKPPALAATAQPARGAVATVAGPRTDIASSDSIWSWQRTSRQWCGPGHLGYVAMVARKAERAGRLTTLRVTTQNHCSVANLPCRNRREATLATGTPLRAHPEIATCFRPTWDCTSALRSMGCLIAGLAGSPLRAGCIIRTSMSRRVQRRSPARKLQGRIQPPSRRSVSHQRTAQANTAMRQSRSRNLHYRPPGDSAGHALSRRRPAR